MFDRVKFLLLKKPLTAKQLIKYGAKIGKNFHNYGDVDYGHAHLLKIGDNVTFAAKSHILMHDASTKKELKYSKVGVVDIGDNVFVGANAIILGPVKIGNKVIIGCGSVVTNDIPSNSVVVGVPAKVIKTYDKYMDESKELFEKAPVFDKYWKEKTNIDKRNEYEVLKNGIIGFDK